MLHSRLLTYVDEVARTGLLDEILDLRRLQEGVHRHDDGGWRDQLHGEGEAHEEGESSSPLHRWEQDHTYRSTGYDIRDHHGHLHPGQTREGQEAGNVHANQDFGVNERSPRATDA